MRLAQRFFLYALVALGVLTVCAMIAVGERARAAGAADVQRQVASEATLLARAWHAGDAASTLADSIGRALERHITLLDARGRVVGDSQERDLAQSWLARYAALPEVVAASADAAGRAHAGTRDAVDAPEIAAAARGPNGVVRVAAPPDAATAAAALLQRGVLLAALVGAAVAAALAWLFARTVARPLTELRDVTRALAAGDLSRRPALSAPGEVGDLATAVHRLTEQLGARLVALEAEEDLLVALSESLTEGVVAIDARQRVVRVNEMARQLLRLRESVPFPADHLPRDRVLREAMLDALAGSATGPVELRLDGRVLALTARPLAGGTGVVLAFFDQTTMRRLEAMRRDFVANVSHELKTPLTAVGGFAETLADDDLPPAQRRHFVETIRHNAMRMQRIVDDLLDLSRIESGGWRPMPAHIDIAAAADEASSAAREAAAKKGVRFAVELGPDAAQLWADATAVRQVLSNLVENAVRHTVTGEVVVTARRSASRGGVWLGVRDTGTGIPAPHLPRIFERFYRADPGRSREAGGTGLGLAIVKHLVEAHGGEVRAQSAVGGGTTIEGFFPDAVP